MKKLNNILVYYVFGFLVYSNSMMSQEHDTEHKDETKKEVKEGRVVPSGQLDFFSRPKKKLDSKFELLKSGEILPLGWIYDIMKQDITTGFVAHLDELAPDILKEDDLFNTTRRNNTTDIPDVGDHVLKGEPWEISMQWWSGEAKGVWWEGYIRHAFLTGDKKAKARSVKIIEYILTTQDKDGYIGIYGENLRYNHKGSNGELWAQTGVFKAMLAYYEFTGDSRVIESVERGMAVTMKKYGEEGKSPYNLVNPTYGGVTHGLMMTDVCDRLTALTGKQKYQDYAVYLYKEFSKYRINRGMDDMRYENLLNKDELFQSHSVHTYEHIRALLNAYYETGYLELREAYESALNKLSYTRMPSGAGLGNEWIAGQVADPYKTAAEFCGMFELRDFYVLAERKSGGAAYADEAEKITFNSILGARNEDGTAIVYCKTDNCFILDQNAPHHGEGGHKDPRYKYSPTHADAAVCCNPNYARNFPYYVGKMWMKANDGLAAVLYGPSKVSTKFKDSQIEIEEVTNYPLSDEIEFKLTLDNPVKMALYFRIPGFSQSMDLFVEGAQVSYENGYYKVSKKWKNGDTIKVSFGNKVEAKVLNDESVYFQRGPIIYAQSIPSRKEVVKEFKLERFTDYNVYPTNSNHENLSYSRVNINDELEHHKGDYEMYENPWFKKGSYLKGIFLNEKSGEKKEIELIPMGSTVLRRVTFPLN